MNFLDDYIDEYTKDKILRYVRVYGGSLKKIKVRHLKKGLKEMRKKALIAKRAIREEENRKLLEDANEIFEREFAQKHGIEYKKGCSKPFFYRGIPLYQLIPFNVTRQIFDENPEAILKLGLYQLY